MTRISDPMDWCQLEKIATAYGVPVVRRTARCQHGKNHQQTCISCDGGYVDDTHTFANVGNWATYNGHPCVAVSDDGEGVAYIADRHQSRLA